MYTETHVREKLAKDGYTPADIEVILRHFPWDDAIMFSGMNCNEWEAEEVCNGWDGLDRRCNCGNRRVYWVVEGDYAYGDAY